MYEIAEPIDAGEEEQLACEGSVAKLKCTEIVKQTVFEAMQLMGGYGCARVYGMEGQVRKALAPPICGGTNEIQRELIGTSLRL